MRKYFIDTMMECAKKDNRVALLMAESGFSVVEPFEKEFPDRFYNTGIAEQNLVLTAAGLAMSGMKPVAYTMASFLPSRAFEMIKISVCYQNLPVVLVATGSGLSYGPLGSTHHSIEESALMRSLPNMNVLFPSSGKELEEAIKFALSEEKPYYISFPKLPAPEIEERQFEFGKAVKYTCGDKATIFAVGFAVHDAMKAAEVLKQKGIETSVYGLHTVKPIDKEAILEGAKNKRIFVIDEHQSVGGVGSEIAKIILEHGMAIEKFVDLGIPDCFVDKVASYNELKEMYHISAEKIVEKVVNNI